MENSEKLKSLIDADNINSRVLEKIPIFNDLMEKINVVNRALYELRRLICLGAPFEILSEKTEDIHEKNTDIDSEVFEIEYKFKKEDEKNPLSTENTTYLGGICFKFRNCCEEMNEFHCDLERGLDFESYKEKEEKINSLLVDLKEELDLKKIIN